MRRPSSEEEGVWQGIIKTFTINSHVSSQNMAASCVSSMKCVNRISALSCQQVNMSMKKSVLLVAKQDVTHAASNSFAVSAAVEEFLR